MKLWCFLPYKLVDVSLHAEWHMHGVFKLGVRANVPRQKQISEHTVKLEEFCVTTAMA